MVINNKKGWVRITEAFIAVLVIVGVMILVVGVNDRGDISNTNTYEFQTNLLHEIQLDSSLRNEILGTSGEVNLTDFPSGTKNKITGSIPVNLECDAKLCDPSSSCSIDVEKETNIYTEFVLISSNITTYNPRILKISCWD